MVSAFLRALFLIFLAEMGDKSQLLMVAMTAEYTRRQILVGVGTAVAVLNLLAIAVGKAVGGLLPETAISLTAGVAFLLFAAGFGEGGESDHSAGKKNARFGAIAAVFGTYFLAELGDKTQLTALTLAAGDGKRSLLSAVAVFFGASLALFAADALGLLVGWFLGGRLPDGAFRILSSILFSVCGMLRVLGGFERVWAQSSHRRLFSVLCTLSTILAVALLRCIAICRERRRDSNTESDLAVLSGSVDRTGKR